MADDSELTDGDYPTEEALERIATTESACEALELAERAWHWDGGATRTLRPEEFAMVARHDDGGENRAFIRFATGGWSGNESIIAALERNLALWASGCGWQLSARGGLHIYEIPLAVEQRAAAKDSAAPTSDSQPDARGVENKGNERNDLPRSGQQTEGGRP